MEILYLPIGAPTFHLESAGKLFVESKEMLLGISRDVVCPDEMLLGMDKLQKFIDGKRPSLVIVQNITFANGAFMSAILRRFSCPVILWTLPEPVIDGGRLRLNSLTGAFSAGNVLKGYDRPFVYVYGAPRDVVGKLTKCIAAANLIEDMRSLNVLQIGHTPEGFGFGRALDSEVGSTFGCNLISIEARELIDAAKACSDADAEEYIAKAKKSIKGLDKIDPANVRDFAKLYKAYEDYVLSHDIGALSSRCWPDFFTSYGTPVCSVLALLNDMGIPSSCEADTYGALSMYLCAKLTGVPAFFGDPVSLDKEENTLTFWHCGMAACSLAREDAGAVAGLHCNRHIGPTLEFGCKAASEVTVTRISRLRDGKFRLYVAGGEALDRPKQFYGTSIVVRLRENAEQEVYRLIDEGLEPHFAIAMGNIEEELKAFARFKGIEVIG